MNAKIGEKLAEHPGFESANDPSLNKKDFEKIAKILPKGAILPQEKDVWGNSWFGDLRKASQNAFFDMRNLASRAAAGLLGAESSPMFPLEKQSEYIDKMTTCSMEEIVAVFNEALAYANTSISKYDRQRWKQPIYQIFFERTAVPA